MGQSARSASLQGAHEWEEWQVQQTVVPTFRGTSTKEMQNWARRNVMKLSKGYCTVSEEE